MSSMARVALLLAILTPPMHASARPGAAESAVEFPSRILLAHNAARARAGRLPLVWDQNLASDAASYAAQMAITGVFQHSDRKTRRGVGENLWMGSRGYFSFDRMVGSWASEKRMYVPGQFPAVSSTGNWADVGHYTQMIWPRTERLGCALASSRTTDYLVCRYSPAGNIDGTAV
jgi:hypothetical protein